MKTSLSILAAITALALAGTIAVPRSAHAQTRQIIIEMYGDSTMQGFSVPNGHTVITTMNEATILQSYFDRDFGPGSVRVTNEGVGSTEASQLLNGTDGVHATWASLMSKSTADIITINHALNDTYSFANPAPGIMAESPQQYHQIMTQLVQTAQAHGKIVVLIEPNPSCNPYRQPTLQYYVANMDQVAQENNVPLVVNYWTQVAMPNWQSLLSDCTHPLDALYVIKANNSYAVLGRIVEEIQDGTYTY